MIGLYKMFRIAILNIKEDTFCPKNHGDVNNPYWKIPENMDKIKYCPYCGKEIVVVDE